MFSLFPLNLGCYMLLLAQGYQLQGVPLHHFLSHGIIPKLGRGNFARIRVPLLPKQHSSEQSRATIHAIPCISIPSNEIHPWSPEPFFPISSSPTSGATVPVSKGALTGSVTSTLSCNGGYAAAAPTATGFWPAQPAFHRCRCGT